jgi:hypothetical protein
LTAGTLCNVCNVMQIVPKCEGKSGIKMGIRREPIENRKPPCTLAQVGHLQHESEYSRAVAANGLSPLILKGVPCHCCQSATARYSTLGTTDFASRPATLQIAYAVVLWHGCWRAYFGSSSAENRSPAGDIITQPYLYRQRINFLSSPQSPTSADRVP